MLMLSYVYELLPANAAVASLPPPVARSDFELPSSCDDNEEAAVAAVAVAVAVADFGIGLGTCALTSSAISAVFTSWDRKILYVMALENAEWEWWRSNRVSFSRIDSNPMFATVIHEKPK
jgi:hypothetical protein